MSNNEATFKFFQEKNVSYDFKGGELTSDSGILLVRELDERLGFTKSLAQCIQDKRNQSLVVHPMEDLLRERIYFLTAGYEDCNDAKTLAHDPGFKVSLGRNLDETTKEGVDLASQPTLCRLENSVTRKDIKQIAEHAVHHWLRQLGDLPSDIILDADSTDDPAHGGQQMVLFHGYYGQYMYHPLIISCNGYVILTLLRPGNSHASRKIISVLKFLMKRIRQNFPQAKIRFRADAGFSIPRLYDYLEGEDIEYAIGLITNSKLIEANETYIEKSKQGYDKTKRKQRLFHSFLYQAGTWSKARKVVAKAEHTNLGPNNRFVVTNSKAVGKAIYDGFYVQRGNSENWIKEIKNGFSADRLSCHRFLANQFRLMMTVAAHQLIQHLMPLLKGTTLEVASIETIRIKLIKVAARVHQTVRKIWIHLCSSYPYQDLFTSLHQKILLLRT